MDPGQWRQRALAALLPGRCLLCDVFTGTTTDLCEHCRTSLPWIARPCRQCGLPLIDAPVPLCGECILRPSPFQQVVAPFAFEAPAAELIRGIKFGGDLVANRVLATLLAAEIAARYDDLPAIILPVPLHWRRLLRRGHNQAALIARTVGRRLGVPIEFDGVRRIRATRAQTGLDRSERRRNLIGAFACRAHVTERAVAVVDDVMTTGATLTAMARCLKGAGASEVHVWTLARTIR
jgi:ComF family protein